MKLSPDDPKLTAYALGEIDDSSEAEEIESAVAVSPELQAAVADIRATAAVLGKALAAESTAEFSASEKDALYTAATHAEADRPRKSRIFVLWPLLGAAAALILLAFLLAPSITTERDAYRQAAVDESEQEAEGGEPKAVPASADPASTVGDRLIARRQSAAVPQSGDSRLEPSLPGSPEIRQSGRLEQPVRGPQQLSSALAGKVESDRSVRSVESLNYGMTDETTHGTAGRHSARSRTRATLGVAADRDYLYSAAPAESFRYRTEPWNTDAFDPIDESAFRSPRVAPLSTFAIDVDTASYAVVRNHLGQGRLPPPAAVRIEELVNYFPYGDAPPQTPVEEGGEPFAVHTEQAPAPWTPEHRLLRVNLKGYEVPWDERPSSNLVFLIDVSGSMGPANRLPLVKEALALLVERLDERDRVAIIVYAGNSKLTLPSTTANNRETIRHAIDELVASGSTHASDGIQRAYKIARRHFIEGGNNRVILCTDGDFNVGITDRGELGEFVKAQSDEGVSLAVLGFGMGNYKDNMLEYLSAKGSGIYGFIDSGAEARKIFLGQIGSNLFSIARDVRIQVEFNPAEVAAYRLIGYENRLMKAEDFNDDSKRAGQIGPGHTVTAFYEIVPPGVDLELAGVDALRYQTAAGEDARRNGGELATIKVRYKRPGEDESELIARHIPVDTKAEFAAASDDFRFGATVAAFGMRLRDSEHIGDYDWSAIHTLGRGALGPDPEGYRTDFLKLVKQAEMLARGGD